MRTPTLYIKNLQLDPSDVRFLMPSIFSFRLNIIIKFSKKNNSYLSDSYVTQWFILLLIFFFSVISIYIICQFSNKYFKEFPEYAWVDVIVCVALNTVEEEGWVGVNYKCYIKRLQNNVLSFQKKVKIIIFSFRNWFLDAIVS